MFRTLLCRSTRRKVGVRGLLTGESLGLPEFEEFRQGRERALCLPKADFWKRIDNYLLRTATANDPLPRIATANEEAKDEPTSVETAKEQPPPLVFTDDVKFALGLASTHEELTKTMKLCHRYNDQSKRIGFFTFSFGPTVARLLYLMKCPEYAYSALTSGEDCYDSLACYQTVMDLLFESGEFQNVLNLYSHYLKHSALREKFPAPKSFQILVMAACYKLGTKESYEFGLECIRCWQNSVKLIQRKALALMVALAAKLDETEMAYELLSLMSSPEQYITGRSLQMKLLARLGRGSEVLEKMARLLEADLPHMQYQDREVSEETLMAVEEMVKVSDNKDWKFKFSKLDKFLRLGGHVIPESIETLVLVPVTLAPLAGELPERLGIPQQLVQLPARQLTESRLADFAYRDDSVELESVNEFRKAEKKRKQDYVLRNVSRQITEDGPIGAIVPESQGQVYQ